MICYLEQKHVSVQVHWCSGLVEVVECHQFEHGPWKNTSRSGQLVACIQIITHKNNVHVIAIKLILFLTFIIHIHSLLCYSRWPVNTGTLCQFLCDRILKIFSLVAFAANCRAAEGELQFKITNLFSWGENKKRWHRWWRCLQRCMCFSFF